MDTQLSKLRHITLTAQGLTNRLPFGTGKKAVLSAIEHLGYIQIDTLSVVERAHHHTLWARIPNYDNHALEALIQERKIFEYWFHAAAYLPIKDFRYSLPRMYHFKRGESRYYNNIDSKLLTDVYDAIRLDGPKKARDFQSYNPDGGSWWNWKPAKKALEKLFMQGDLMICGRQGMEKIYDLTENVLPSGIDTTEPSSMELAEYLVNTHLRAYGVTSIKQITHLRNDVRIKKHVELVLQTMLQTKTVQALHIKGIPTLFIDCQLLEAPAKTPPSHIKLLSPFDNAIIHRDRLKQLFGFDFRLECYIPKEKRQYGYFCLPILFGNTFIGRMDCKAYRKDKQLSIIHLHIENQTVDIDSWLEPLVNTIRQFASFNHCDAIKLLKTSPSHLTQKLKPLLKLP